MGGASVAPLQGPADSLEEEEERRKETEEEEELRDMLFSGHDRIGALMNSHRSLPACTPV